MAAIKTAKLTLPASTEDLRKLEIGTVVYLTGRVFTAREGVYKRAVEDGAGLPAAPEQLGFANFHCSPAATSGSGWRPPMIPRLSPPILARCR